LRSLDVVTVDEDRDVDTYHFLEAVDLIQVDPGIVRGYVRVVELFEELDRFDDSIGASSTGLLVLHVDDDAVEAQVGDIRERDWGLGGDDFRGKVVDDGPLGLLHCCQVDVMVSDTDWLEARALSLESIQHVRIKGFSVDPAHEYFKVIKI